MQKRIALFGRLFNDDVIPYVQDLIHQLETEGAELHIYAPFHAYLSARMNFGTTITTFNNHKELIHKIDFLISIGGDGTILDAITMIRDSEVPILGINTGRLGFLAGISKDEIEGCIKGLLEGNYQLDRRTLLEVKSTNNLFGNFNYALNELTVHKKDSSSMITIHAFLNDEFLNTYWADGLIIATPTGSSAYSLSCGGPIMMPGSENFIITPIAPHNLNVRPFVVPDNSKVTLKVEVRGKHYLAALDS